MKTTLLYHFTTNMIIIKITLAKDLFHVIFFKQFHIFFWLEWFHEQKRQPLHLMVGNNDFSGKKHYLYQLNDKHSRLQLKSSHSPTSIWEKDVASDYSTVVMKAFDQCNNRLHPISHLHFTWTIHWLGYFYDEIWFVKGNHVKVIFFGLVLHMHIFIVQNWMLFAQFWFWTFPVHSFWLHESMLHF